MALVALPVPGAGNGLATTAPGAETVTVRADRRGAGGDIRQDLGDRLVLEAAFALQSDHESFGGLSGLWLSPDGTRMIAISDIGQRWEATLSHDADGRLTGAGNWSVADLPLRPGEADSTSWLDSEALAGMAPHHLVVAYEGEHRLRRWALEDLNAPPEPVTLPMGLGGQSNSGIEALADLGDGHLFALAERAGAPGGRGLLAWVIDVSSARDLVYTSAPGFSPTGAVRLEDMIYLVERKFSLLGGFQSRIVTLPVDAVRPGARIGGTPLAAFRWGDLGANFEAIAARRAPDGRILLYILADDNFSFFQETLLVQLSVSPAGVTE